MCEPEEATGSLQGAAKKKDFTAVVTCTCIAFVVVVRYDDDAHSEISSKKLIE